jgi:hypothetical protein
MSVSTDIGSAPTGNPTIASAVSGSPPHGVDVGQRVRRGDLPELVRIVDDGREEVDRLHEREILPNEKDSGVVEAFATDDEPGVRVGWHASERLREISRAKCRGAPCAARPGREPNGAGGCGSPERRHDPC